VYYQKLYIFSQFFEKALMQGAIQTYDMEEERFPSLYSILRSIILPPLFNTV
jgi:hypothetical protein